VDGEKLECLVAGHRERAVRNVSNVDPGGARLEHDRLAVGRDGGGAAYDLNRLSAGVRVPRFAILNPSDRRLLGSVSLITYVGSNVAMLPQLSLRSMARSPSIAKQGTQTSRKIIRDSIAIKIGRRVSRLPTNPIADSSATIH
jgi:hypothetical protein